MNKHSPVTNRKIHTTVFGTWTSWEAIGVKPKVKTTGNRINNMTDQCTLIIVKQKAMKPKINKEAINGLPKTLTNNPAISEMAA